jgi:ketosteroid isomerase-like protein
MTRTEALAFAEHWIDNWNRRDVDAVLSHFADDAVFTTPKGELFVGTPVLKGKAALANYWRLALARIKELHFTLDHAVWDDATRELVVFYRATFDGKSTRACELMKFDAAGRQVSGEALYGAAV